MDNQDWKEQDRISEELRISQQLKIKDNTIKDLQVSNDFLRRQVDELLKENHDLHRGLTVPRTEITPRPTLQSREEALKVLHDEALKLQTAITKLKSLLGNPPTQ